MSTYIPYVLTWGIKVMGYAEREMFRWVLGIFLGLWFHVSRGSIDGRKGLVSWYMMGWEGFFGGFFLGDKERGCVGNGGVGMGLGGGGGLPGERG